MLRHKFTVILTELWWIFCADTVYLSLTNENSKDNDASIYADLSGINKVYTYIEAQADRCFESKNEWLQSMQIPLGDRFKLVAKRANVQRSFFPAYSYPNEAETKADIQQTL